MSIVYMVAASASAALRGTLPLGKILVLAPIVLVTLEELSFDE